MSNVCVSQAYTCAVPNMLKNVRQLEDERDSHHWHSLGLRLSIWRSFARKKNFLCMRETNSHIKAQTDTPWPHAQGGKSLQVCANRSNHALQTFQHPVLALYHGSGSIDCHTRPCRPWAECLNEGGCSIAGSLWTVQSVSCWTCRKELSGSYYWSW